MHVREAGPQLGDVTADQRVGHQVDMVGDDHQVAHAERGIDPARSVRHEEVFDAQLLHDAHRESHLLHRVALVVVEAPLHGHDLAALDRAEDHTPLVPLDGRNGETRDIFVFDGECSVDLIGETAQAGAEDDAHLRGERTRGGVDKSRCFFNFL